VTLNVSHFGAFHAAVHRGKQPFAWQQRLLEQIVREKRWPRVLDLPTGTGKTTCIDIAVFALALDAQRKNDERWCPRRIAMVVDRRIVVDQVAERGRALLRALLTGSGAVIADVAKRLRSLSGVGEEPLGVFTLRGGMPKDDGWARAPDQPLIVGSTVDQIGSRMLMQGYGVSEGMKPVHAGLLANDTLLLLDEVHLSEPFRQTLDQLARFRTRFSGEVKTRFAHAFLSATPSAEIDPPFSLLEDDKRADSPLGSRLHASKPTRLLEVGDRASLEKACVQEAKSLLHRHRTVAVVVNRVGSAGLIARQLTENLGSDTAVTLLTGRMRPLDRDDVLRELRPSIQTGRERHGDPPKRVIVGTQCIEAGADFDFDALVTEAASLDSLRQRFGRVDRLGHYLRAEGVIVYDNCSKLKEELKRRGEKPSLAEEDPIYGRAAVETVKWLKAKLTKKRPFADFGVLALEIPQGDELSKLLAPKPNAPTLMPAYLDLWAQTSPAPSQTPDVSLWLHGPASGPADVQVLWRADLSDEILRRGDVEAATAIIAAVRPSSLEALSVPFATARAWLAEQASSDLGDTEGPEPEENETPNAGRLALRWNGDESEIVCAQSVTAPSLRPGDTIVVPVTYGGIRGGCFDPSSTEPVRDRAEQAELFARARPVLRLHPAVVEALGLALPLDEPDHARDLLGRLAARDDRDWPEWKRLWAQSLGKGRGSIVVTSEPSWTVLQGRRVRIGDLRSAIHPDDSIEDGVELTTDVDDSIFADRAIMLADHTADVEELAREYAERCGLNAWLAAHVSLAAWVHDIGKADRRFQLMLRGGSEIEFFKDETPWAKSAMPPGAREARQLAQQRSGYPRGARHEVQSLAMLEGRMDLLRACLSKVASEREPDIELVLHLVASHHGYCRPFAPVVVDETPVDVSLARHQSAVFGTIDFPSTTSKHELHRLDAPIADRFWGLVARYGWQELCWLEAILRLADHRASEEEQAGEAAS
jgi:CRISPR-associated endonuclease/helicase Cas3